MYQGHEWNWESSTGHLTYAEFFYSKRFDKRFTAPVRYYNCLAWNPARRQLPGFGSTVNFFFFSSTTCSLDVFYTFSYCNVLNRHVPSSNSIGNSGWGRGWGGGFKTLMVNFHKAGGQKGKRQKAKGKRQRRQRRQDTIGSQQSPFFFFSFYLGCYKTTFFEEEEEEAMYGQK